MPNERILITGCGGMLGEAVYEAYSRASGNVLATDIDCNEPWLEYLDVRDLNACEGAFKNFHPSLVVHLAALTDLEFCETHRDEAFRTNALGTEHVALLAARHQATMVLVSTAGVFDGTKEEYTEFDTPHPINAYGESKYQAERFVAEHVLKHFIFRAGWMMGGGRKDKKFVRKIFDQIRGGAKELFVVEDKLGTPTYTVDFAQSLLRVVASGSFGLYHQVCRGSASRFEVAQEFVRLLALADEVAVRRVPSDYFKTEYFAPRPRSEKLANFKLEQRRMNYMRDWRVCLREYSERFKELAAREKKMACVPTTL